MEKNYWKTVTSSVILVVLIVLSFLLLKSILLSLITGILVALIFTPLYNKLLTKIKSKNFATFLICFLFIILIVLPLWFIVPILIDQSISIYITSQQIDFVTPLETLFPTLFNMEGMSAEIGSAIYSFVTQITNSVMNILSNLILNFPTIFLHTIVMFFTFFFVLRDGKKFIAYIQSLLPFSKEVEKKLFKSSKDITLSILYGQVVIGILQGLIAGIGFFLFGLENALFLIILACIAGIFPIVGASIVWVPVAIYMIVSGEIFGAMGIVFFGLIAAFFENIIKPIFVSRRTNVHSAIILVGMIGGLFFLGILGVILGPLILAYLLIVLEIYRDKSVPGLFVNK